MAVRGRHDYIIDRKFSDWRRGERKYSHQRHEIKRLPAAIVRAEPAGSHTRYSLRFHKDRLASADKGLTVRLLNYLAHQYQS